MQAPSNGAAYHPDAKGVGLSERAVRRHCSEPHLLRRLPDLGGRQPAAPAAGLPPVVRRHLVSALQRRSPRPQVPRKLLRGVLHDALGSMSPVDYAVSQNMLHPIPALRQRSPAACGRRKYNCQGVRQRMCSDNS
jgi:hypothetical protein